MTEHKLNTLDIARRRLLFQSVHRGTKELDQLLENYARIRVNTMDAAACAAYDALLSEDETDLFNWLTDQAPWPPEHAVLLKDILAVWPKNA